jgi:hypothetical protein
VRETLWFTTDLPYDIGVSAIRGLIHSNVIPFLTMEIGHVRYQLLIEQILDLDRFIVGQLNSKFILDGLLNVDLSDCECEHVSEVFDYIQRSSRHRINAGHGMMDGILEFTQQEREPLFEMTLFEPVGAIEIRTAEP